MRFRKYGNTYQLRLECAADLAVVLTLDEALWMATSAPVSSFRCDRRFLELIDFDKNGRIHTHELRTAVRWLLDILTDKSGIETASDALFLEHVDRSTPRGAALAQAAAYMLESANCCESVRISLLQVRQFLAGLKNQPLNGDGRVPSAASNDPEVQRFIAAAVAHVASTGAAVVNGIDRKGLDSFGAAVSAVIAWRERLQKERDRLLPFGEETAAACGVYRENRTIVEDYFTLARAIHFDARIAARAECPPPQPMDSSATSVMQTLQQEPLARPRPDGMLPLKPAEVNPFYRARIRALTELVVKPVFGERKELLSENDWMRIGTVLSPFLDYEDAKPLGSVNALPLETLILYRDSQQIKARVVELLAADARVAELLGACSEVEKLILFQQNMLRFANNFVSFTELYNPAVRALFEMGSAVIDGRWFNFAVDVENLAVHCALAKNSKLFVIYLEVEESGTGRRYHVAVPATSGTKGSLSVGKRCVFFDISGVEHDARIVQVIENPISTYEAVTGPFVRLWEFIIGKIEAMSGTSEKQLQAELQKNVDHLKQPPKDPSVPVAGTAMGRNLASGGLVMGLGVSLAAISSAFAFVTKTFSQLGSAQLLLGLLGGALVVGIPVFFVAWVNLMRQNLGLLLEASGWAVNRRMRPNRAQRRQFTTRPSYPFVTFGNALTRWFWYAVAVAVGTTLFYWLSSFL